MNSLHQINQVLFHQHYLSIHGILYQILDIEYYLNNDCHQDPYAHIWYVNNNNKPFIAGQFYAFDRPCKKTGLVYAIDSRSVVLICGVSTLDKNKVTNKPTNVLYLLTGQKKNPRGGKNKADKNKDGKKLDINKEVLLVRRDVLCMCSIYGLPRHGLILQSFENESVIDDATRYIYSNLRYLILPEKQKKDINFLIFLLLEAGHPVDLIIQITGRSIGYIETLAVLRNNVERSLTSLEAETLYLNTNVIDNTDIRNKKSINAHDIHNYYMCKHANMIVKV
jgi:hypothetical protein